MATLPPLGAVRVLSLSLCLSLCLSLAVSLSVSLIASAAPAVGSSKPRSPAACPLSVSLCLSLCDSLCLAAVGVAGEWMMPPVGAHTNPASGFAGDYTPQMEVEFCANERASGRGGGACKLATAAERNKPTLGNAMMQWASSAEPAAKAFRMNRFLSERTAQAIAATAAAVKSASGGSALTAAFYGYLFSLSDTRLTGSGHLSLGAVLTDPNLDVIVSPWQYRDETRQRGGAMTVHGPIDSAGNHANKLWAIEDDTYLLSRCRLPLAAELLWFDAGSLGNWHRFCIQRLVTCGFCERHRAGLKLRRDRPSRLDIR